MYGLPASSGDFCESFLHTKNIALLSFFVCFRFDNDMFHAGIGVSS